MVALPPEAVVAASIVLAAAGGLLALALGVVVLRAAPMRDVNRRLAALLLAEGLVHVLAFTRLEGLPIGVAKTLSIVHFTSVAALPFLYLLLLATLSTPFVAFLRRRAVTPFLVAFPALVVLVNAPILLALPYTGTGPPPGIADFYRLCVLLVGAVSLFGLAAAVSEIRRTAPQTPDRVRAISYAVAFGVRDVLFLALLLNSTLFRIEPMVWPTLATFLFVPILAYGLLRTQLLNVDLRMRWTIERGTVVLVFVGLALVASQAAQAFVSARHGPALGILASALLVVALLVPLKRLARTVGATLMPGVEDSPAYLNRRRLEIYRSALEHAVRSGGGELPAGERAILASLREELGVTERDAAVLEFVVAQARAPRVEGTLAPGELVLGKYRVVRLLGEGAHARTYLAEQSSVGRQVVVKTLGATSSADAADALREARATAAVRHPNVVTVHDVEQAGATILLVLEHVEGGSLRDRLASGSVSAPEFRRVAHGLLAALDAVHRSGAVHRDVKPGNVLLTREGDAKLADFGIATLRGDATVGLGRPQPPVVGTPRYMSPEQAKGMRVTAQSDLYSAAATLYEAYSGEAWLAFAPGEASEEARMRAAAAGAAFDRVVEPPALAEWFARALDPEPARRFASAGEMQDALVVALARGQREAA